MALTEEEARLLAKFLRMISPTKTGGVLSLVKRNPSDWLVSYQPSPITTQPYNEIIVTDIMRTVIWAMSRAIEDGKM